MSDSMETGGVGKNPAIDKINKLNAVSSRVKAATELEKKVFCPGTQRGKDVLCRRKQLREEFHISFKRAEENRREDFLYGEERRLFTGERSVQSMRDGRKQSVVRTAGGLQQDEQREDIRRGREGKGDEIFWRELRKRM